MTCKNCGYNHVHVHKTKDSILTYCERCGTDTTVKVENRPDRWTDEMKEQRNRQPCAPIVSLVPKKSNSTFLSTNSRKKKKKRKAG